MSPRKPGIPRLRRHRRHRCGVVRLSGQDYYLGAWPDAYFEAHGLASPPPAVREAYDRVLGEWLARARQPKTRPESVTVSQLILRHLPAAEQEHQKDYDEGRSATSEYGLIVRSLGHLRDHYGATRAADFGPMALKAVRERLVAAGLARRTVNAYVYRIKGLFRWASENELVPPTVYHSLLSVRALRSGRTPAPDHPPVPPADPAHVEALARQMPDVPAAMVRVQLLTGMRPGEVCRLRTSQMDRTTSPWVYRPSAHKTTHHGRERRVYIGPKARDLLLPYVEVAGADGYLFRPPRSKQPRYPVSAYSTLVREGCLKHGIPPFTPNQLRHSLATAVRAAHGIEAAQVLLGHEHISTTEVYAERSGALAKRVIEEMG